MQGVDIDRSMTVNANVKAPAFAELPADTSPEKIAAAYLALIR
jgi:hypothetical protein